MTRNSRLILVMLQRVLHKSIPVLCKYYQETVFLQILLRIPYLSLKVQSIYNFPNAKRVMPIGEIHLNRRRRQGTPLLLQVIQQWAYNQL